LITHVWGGRGVLTQYLNLLSFSFHVPFTLTLWVVETSTAVFRPELWGNSSAPGAMLGHRVWQTLLWMAVTWSVLLSGWAIKQVSDLSWPKSLATAMIATAATIGFYLIFIR
jgi:hypothetical protein